MAVRTAEELLASVRTRIGDDQSDEAIALIEDVSDTLNSMKNDSNEEWKKKYEEWKKKYEENDANWRQKYRDRFFSPSNDDDEGGDDIDIKPLTYDALFKED